jgi:hypothetical protein
MLLNCDLAHLPDYREQSQADKDFSRIWMLHHCFADPDHQYDRYTDAEQQTEAKEFHEVLHMAPSDYLRGRVINTFSIR